MNKGSFLFRKEWADALKGQSNNTRLNFYEAIIRYAFTGKINAASLTPLSMAVFLVAKAEVDRVKETSEKRRMAGKKGKRKKKKVVERSKNTGVNIIIAEETPPPAPPIPQTQPPLPPPVEAGLVADNSVEIIDVKKPATHTPSIGSRQQKFYNSLIPYVEKYGREMVRDFYDYWTETTRSGAKMRFELQPTWVVSKRLARWNLQSKSKILHEQSTSNPETRARDAADLIASLAEDE